ncbi:MAG: hypothetical protein ACI8Q1_001974 [Parvicella sp.]|jgi:antitoxin component YwqK of YwqJK toxin-antitoxin module
MKLLITVLCFLNICSIAQNKTNLDNILNEDKKVETEIIYNFFKQTMDSSAIDFGVLQLFHYTQFLYDTIIFERTLDIDSDKTGTIKYTNKDKVIFSYNLFKGEIYGVCKGYFAESGNIAIQGEFKNSLLHGYLIVSNPEGKVIWIAKYSRGKLKKYVYHWAYRNKYNLRMLKKDEPPLPNE